MTSGEWIGAMYDFCHWVAREVIDEEEWQTNQIAFPELALRKLYKLGIVETDEKRWIYIDKRRQN